MGISAKQVKELRDKTGIGMMECKKALEVTEGNMDEAVEYLRKHNKNLTKVNNREAREGICRAAVVNLANGLKRGVILELNTETDFSARTELIDKLADDLITILANHEDELGQEKINEAISVLGENVVLRRFVRITPFGNVYAYNHQGRVAVLVFYEGDSYKPETEGIIKNVAMQIASMAPEYVGLSDIPREVIDKEKEIITELVYNDPSNGNNPTKVKDGIVTGKLKKLLNEKCLLNQIYIKAEKKRETVGDYLFKADHTIKILGFFRYEVGEGMDEKSAYEKQREFVNEMGVMVGDIKTVANQMQGIIAVAKDEKYFSEETKRNGTVCNEDEMVR